jgi:hypothetical protein
MTIYPDVSDVFMRKAEARKKVASLSFAEKIAIIEAMRERVAPFKRAREQRLATQPLATQEHRPAKRESHSK